MLRWAIVVAAALLAAGASCARAQSNAASSPQPSPAATSGTGGDAFPAANFLLGDLGGDRSRLYNDGFTFSPVYTGEVMGNPSGGHRAGTIYEGLLNLAVDFDLGKMSDGAVEDLTIHANALEIHGPSLSLYDTGDLNGASSIAAYNTLRLQELWVQKQFWQQRLSIKAGNIAVDTEFFQAPSAALFIGNTFGAFSLFAFDVPNPPVYPTASPGLRLKLAPTPETYVMAGVFGEDAKSDPATNNQNGTRFALNAHSGMLLLLEMGYLLNQGPQDHGLTGSYRLGAFVDTGNFDTWSSRADAALGRGPLRGTGCDYGIYGVIDQQLCVCDAGTVSFFVRAAGAPGNVNLIDYYCDGGCNFAGFVPKRPNDIAGLAVARSHISPAYSAAQVEQGFLPYIAETFFEASYRVQLEPWWSIQPAVQYIVTPSAEQGSKNATVLGLRTNVAF